MLLDMAANRKSCNPGRAMAGAEYTALEMIDRLVAFDTTSRNSNLELIDFVADYLAGHGIHLIRFFDDDGGKANLFASLGPAEPGGVVPSGHTEVVPVKWRKPPHRLFSPTFSR